MKNKVVLWAIVGLIGAAVALAVISGLNLGGERYELGVQGKVIEYSSPGCGCCGFYEQYLQDQSDLDIELVRMDTLSELKDEYGVPPEVRSCHMTVIGDYFVEGHVPLEVIEKLLTEKPDIAGIALPGMPSGTPGMPGPIRSPWTIYAVHHDGSTSEYLTI